ncbi:MAG: DUF5666 domain-containing protein [Blastocatellia bacterium]|jgi:uncharacterized protein (TIGR03437 family)
MNFSLSQIARHRTALVVLILAGLSFHLLPLPQLFSGVEVRGVGAAMQNSPSIKIEGPILALPAEVGWVGEWTIGRTKVNVTSKTKIEGRPAISAYAEAQVTRQSNGGYEATKIEIRSIPTPSTETSFVDRIEELPSTPGRIGNWKIGSRTVVVNDLTRIDARSSEVAIGANALVRASSGPAGTLIAAEINILPAPPAPGPLKMVGRIEKLPTPTITNEGSSGWPGDWVISGRTLIVTQQTVIEERNGKVMIGAEVEVTVSITGGERYSATKVVVLPMIQLPPLPVSLRGKIESLPTTSGFIGDWQVAGRTIKVTAQTRITGKTTRLVVGALVEVRGIVENGQVQASAVTVLEDEATSGNITFVGEITSIQPSVTASTGPSLVGTWKVGERTVQVVATTKIDQSNGSAQVGAIAEVEGSVQPDGTVLAREIEIKRGTGSAVSYTRFYGTIETLPNGGPLTGTWVVSGRQVTVGARTRIVREHGTPAVGAFVQVEGSQRADGAVDAVTIQVERDKDAPAGTIGFLNFYGSVVALPPPSEGKFLGEWTIGSSNRQVVVDAQTRIETQRGEIKVGAFVEVKGYLSVSGPVKAISIAVRPTPPAGSPIGSLSYLEFIARITELPAAANFIGQWTFDNGRKVNVRRSTLIDRQRSRIEVGALAEVVGAELPNGEIDARSIEVEFGTTTTAAGFTQFRPITSVSAASYAPGGSSASIIASFGTDLATTTETAPSLPLPIDLGGVSVMVDGRPAGLFFVSPGQINYQVPDELLPGVARVSVLRNGQPVAQGTIEINATTPSVFTADSSGAGTPAGQVLRVKSNGEVRYEPLSRWDGGSGRVLPVTIERQQGDQLFLVLYGTGWSGIEDQDGNAANGVAELVEVTSGTNRLDVLYAGKAPGYAGLDQLNLTLPASLVGEVNLTIRVRDGEGNVRRSNEVTIRVR